MDYTKSLYIIMETNYLKEIGRNLTDDNSDIFPFNWYLSNNYKLKTEILYDAIKTKNKIVDLEKYQILLKEIQK